MNWYFASRTRHKKDIESVSKFLEAQGEIILSTWVYETPPQPYDAHIEEAQKLAEQIGIAVLDTGVFVLVSDEGGTDMFIELGLALAKVISKPKSIRIYIVGKHSKRSLLQLHKDITHEPSLREVFEKEHILHEGFDFPNLS